MIPHYDTRLFIMYKDCGAEAMFTALDGRTENQNPPMLLQQGDHQCQYGQTGSPPCWFYPTNTWITMYFKVHVGRFRQPDSTIEAWYAVNGGPYRKWLNVTSGFTIYCNQDPPNACAPGSSFNNLTLTPYMTALSRPAPVTAYMWFDELIVSTQPIAAPGAAEIDNTPPATPGNLRLSSLWPFRW
jgi:hypothetical protein